MRSTYLRRCRRRAVQDVARSSRPSPPPDSELSAILSIRRVRADLACQELNDAVRWKPEGFIVLAHLLVADSKQAPDRDVETAGERGQRLQGGIAAALAKQEERAAR